MSEEIISTLKILVLDDQGARAKAILSLVEGAPGIEVVIGSFGGDDGIGLVKKQNPGILIVVSGQSVPLESIERLSLAYPDLPIVAVLEPNMRQAETDCVLAGARLCLTSLGSREEFIGNLRRLHSQERRKSMKLAAAAVLPYESKLGQIIAVHAAKGGAGATTISSNMAIALKQNTKAKVALVDANLQSGDVSVLLDLYSGNNIADLLSHLKELDDDLLREVMVEHGSGVRVLLAPPLIEQADAVKADQVHKILASMRQAFSFIVVDTSPLLEPVTISVLDDADLILSVTTPDIQALRNTARFFRLAEQFGYAPDKVRLVVNKVNTPGAIPLGEIQGTLQKPIMATVHMDGKEVAKAANRGDPIVLSGPGNKVSKDIREIAAILTGHKAPLKVETPDKVGMPDKQEKNEGKEGGRARLMPF
jgi:pilus assembly protein CpaE